MKLTQRASLPWLAAIACLSIVSSAATAQTNWTSDPIITSDSCEALGYDKALLFLNNHFVPAVAYLSDSTASEAKLLQAYAISTALTVRSQQCLAEALSLKEITAKLKADQAIIKSGTSMGKNEIEKQRKLSEEADAAIRAAATQERQLTPDQRKSFSLGVATYLAGTYATSELVEASEAVINANKAKATNTSAPRLGGLGSMLKGAKDTVDAAKYAALIAEIAKGVTGQMKRLASTSRTLVSYAKTNNIELPADATSKLDSLTKWE